jgi:hypothetical protein
MPIYCYKCKNGHVTEKFVAAMHPYVSCDCETCGRKARRSFSDEMFNTDLVNNERVSESMGVQPHQIQEAMKTFPGSEYTKDGGLKIHSRKHKKEEMKRRGYVELD